MKRKSNLELLFLSEFLNEKKERTLSVRGVCMCIYINYIMIHTVTT